MVETRDRPHGVGDWLRRLAPFSLLVMAAFLAVVHITPLWRAQLQTPDGWTFTGNLMGSPDVMQYRVLAHRSQEIGPIVDNRMTTEPNIPHIPMFFYYGIGQVATWVGASPAMVLAYAGSLFAFILAFFLFWVIYHFLRSRYRTWWVFSVLVFGGGLGAHLIIISRLGPIADNAPVRRIVMEGLANGIVFEYYRNHYILTTLFDSHFLFFLLVAMLAVASYYFALKQFSYGRLALAAAVFGLTTVLHIYDGVTLLAIGAGVVFVLWRKGLPIRPALFTLAACTATVAAAVLWQVWLYKASGLTIPRWRADSVMFANLALAYPVGWGLMLWGFADFWKRASFDECFLLGWVLGGTLLTLSGPFYPYPDRGTLTLQIPIYIIAGMVFFARWSRVQWRAAVVGLAILGATPLFVADHWWRETSVTLHPSGKPAPYIWMTPEHVEIGQALSSRSGTDDVLIVDKENVPWQTDDLWLAPLFRGKLYAGHFALTPGYEQKREELIEFYQRSGPTERAAFLQREDVRFVYVAAEQAPDTFVSVPGLTEVVGNTVGSLFEFTPSPQGTSR